MSYYKKLMLQWPTRKKKKKKSHGSPIYPLYAINSKFNKKNQIVKHHLEIHPTQSYYSLS